MKIKLHFLLTYMEYRARKVCSGTPSLLASSYTSHMMTVFSECRGYFPHHRNFLAANLEKKIILGFWIQYPSNGGRTTPQDVKMVLNQLELHLPQKTDINQGLYS